MLNKKKVSNWLLKIAGTFFIISAMGQGFFVINEITHAIKNLPSYWFNRISMYCWLVNLSMWMIGILLFYGAYLQNRGKDYYLVVIIPGVYALLMAILILILTPSDWWHTIFVFAAIILIFISLIFNFKNVNRKLA
jgi:hypothetical protein